MSTRHDDNAVLDAYNTIQGLILAVVLSLLIVASLFVGNSDYEAKAKEEARYCEMVRRHYETRGMAGWPDYRGYAHKRCFKDQQVADAAAKSTDRK